ncbi:MAG: hypothetical protein GC190_09465 [Alphaproteobacteria bacterium]|nr:hypothetical protein [Alphaproteobacteria bacterium]
MVKPDRELYEPPYDDALMYDTVEEPQGPRGRPLVVLLGFVVLAAFAAVVWVAYQQGVKEGQRTNPPILSAESGPTRVAPQTPQTADATPTEKSFERLSGESGVMTGDEQIMPAPEEPRPLPSPQDMARAPAPSAQSMIAPPAPAPSFVGPSGGRPDTDHPGLDTTVSSISPTETPSAQRMMGSQATHSAKPATAPEDLSAALPPAEGSSLAATPTHTAPPAKPSKPKPAPAAPATTSTPAADPGGEGGPLETAELEPGTASSLPSVSADGPIAIQLGSFPSDVLAAQSWGRIKSKNVAILGDYNPKFQRAVIEGKGTWYRLQVTGFADRSSAQNVCNKLKANGQACIITTAK